MAKTHQTKNSKATVRRAKRMSLEILKTQSVQETPELSFWIFSKVDYAAAFSLAVFSLVTFSLKVVKRAHSLRNQIDHWYDGSFVIIKNMLLLKSAH